METYWMYRTRVGSYRNQLVVAKLVSPSTPVPGIKSPFQEELYGVDLNPVYQVNPKWRHPDNYCDSFGFNLFSRRLVDLMREFGVRHESFLADMVDKTGRRLLNLEYYVAHFLGNMFEPGPLMIDNKKYKLLMRNDMMEEILQRGISGFEFLSQVFGL
ncbi:MAG: hypothetical protein G01um101416_976 [Microgenomates group bacterium Gr01-1014_16]|nr:MAG: hypothetical protein G01um101416_976 [Microgenomates group bacterium Gr01-1014_16]